jgi:hypothetical protein
MPASPTNEGGGASTSTTPNEPPSPSDAASAVVPQSTLDAVYRVRAVAARCDACGSGFEALRC